jgi:anaerobic magnesium-protoporphyrin IX monomethyl ester cyclase
MPKILLIYPPSKTQHHESCPMGMQLLASILLEHEYEVILLDANAAKQKMNTEQIIKRAQELQPDIIGITLLTPMIREAYNLSRKLKQMGFTLLAGGPHASLVPEETLQYGFDAAVIGEGESAIHEAIQALLGKIPKSSVPGWSYKDESGKAVTTVLRPLIKELDSIPYPARHMVKADLYGGRVDGVLHANLFSSRGCPAKCSFCSGQLFGKKFRFRSALSMVDEIEYLNRTYGTTEFHFEDDAMTLHKKRLYEFCELLKERKLSIRWSIMTRIDATDEAFLETIKKAGCFQIDYGVESGDPETLKKIHKPHTVEMVKKVIPMTAKMGINPFVFFILGFPWENNSTLENTLQLMKDISPYVSNFHPAVASILVPFPGTEIYEQYKDVYGFENWWLSDDKNFDVMVPQKTSYYESKIFHLGNILKADFFKYDDSVKKKIYEIFHFMYFHNLTVNKSTYSQIQKYFLLASKQLGSFSKPLEKFMFLPVRRLENILKSSMH